MKNFTCIFICVFTFMIISASIANATSTTHEDLCSNYNKKKEYEKAIDICTESIDVFTKALAYYYIHRAFAYNKRTEYEKSIADCTKAIDLDPLSSDAYNGRASGYVAVGKYNEAIADYTMAIKLKPDESGIYNNRAMAYHFKGDHDKAMADLMKAIELNPKDSLSYYNIACLYSIKNNIEEACKWLSKAIENGYNNWDSIKQDKDLANIRNSPCYKQIISGKEKSREGKGDLLK